MYFLSTGSVDFRMGFGLHVDCDTLKWNVSALRIVFYSTSLGIMSVFNVSGPQQI